MADSAVIRSLQLARGYFMQEIKGLTESQLTEVPDGASNNILWNVGHIVTSNCGMVYGPCGLDSPIPAGYTDLFKGGTSPKDWSSTPSVDEVMGHFKGVNKDIAEKYASGGLNSYKAIELGPGFSLATIDDALGFCCIHEGVHIGASIALKKRVS